MLKHLLLPSLALAFCLPLQAQVKAGLAFDHEIITSKPFSTVGEGLGYGGSIFFRLPFHHDLELDWSADLGGGHLTTENLFYHPTPSNFGYDFVFTSVKSQRSFFYAVLPVYFIYTHSFRHVRLFAGPGAALSLLSWGGSTNRGWDAHGHYNTVAIAFKTGIELYQRATLSAEFRPWKAELEKARETPGNLAALKLGYEFPLPKNHSHMSPDHK